MKRTGRILRHGFFVVSIMSLMIALNAAVMAPTADAEEVIIDNNDAATAQTGTWSVSGGYYPWPTDTGDSVWARDGRTFSWIFTPSQSGFYTTSMWWTQWDSRGTNIPVDIHYQGGSARVFINQQTNAGQWNSLGDYYFEAGNTYEVTITAVAYPESTCADAVKFNLLTDSPTTVYIDNGAPNTSFTGSWHFSSGEPSWPADGTNLWSRDGSTYTWKFAPTVSGIYDVAMWWTAWSSRTDAAPVDILFEGGKDVVIVNQQLNAGQWNTLSRQYFAAGKSYDVTITSQPYPASTCADAVRFTRVDADLTGISIVGPAEVDENSEAQYECQASYSNGEVHTLPADSWSVSGGGASISSSGLLNAGSVTADTVVQITAVYSEGGLQMTTTKEVTVRDVTAAQAFYIDNGDPATSFTGIWESSGGPSPWPVDGGTSLWSRDGTTYTWQFAPVESGYYDLSMWWTQWSSRSSSIPVRIQHVGGPTTVSINQTVDGGRWNSLGIFPFEAGLTYNVTIVSQPYPTSTCADAVRFVKKAEFSGGGTVGITSPKDFDLFTSSTIQAAANTANLQDGWGVRFVLDLGQAGETVKNDYTSPFQVSFLDVAAAEHTVDVFIIDAAGDLVEGDFVHDQVIQIGVGEYFVALGDSITAGYGDDITSDNASADGRDITRGYSPVLNDLLTLFKDYPHKVANEGVLSAVAADGAASINDILARHPQARYVLIQYGTNDAIQGYPSGLGLQAGNTGYAYSYKDYLQRIIAAVNASGKQACLAKPPIALGLSSGGAYFDEPEGEALNALLRDYGAVIDELIADPDNNIPTAAPDFYAYFTAVDPATGMPRYNNQYYDRLHPNGTGYQSIAALWAEHLTEPKAFIVDISPAAAATGESISFTGVGKKLDGTVTAYRWTSDLDGVLATSASFTTSLLTTGIHTISFEVRDDASVWSDPAYATVYVGTKVIDNRDAAVSFTGDWWQSGAAGPYGADSVWSRDGTTFTWNMTAAASGYYDLWMWWTVWSSRTMDAPVDVTHANGVERVYVNQQSGAGQWNYLGTFQLQQGVVYPVTITSQPYPTSTCADAIMITPAP